ncbi:PIN domain-containing protein [soil metagenome]
MIGADTNLLIRFLVRDVEEQAEKVKNLFEKGEQFYINAVVLSEIWWVLTSVYGYSKNEFVMAMDLLLETEGVFFFNRGTVRSALADYIHSTAGFSDCLIHRINSEANLNTLTFDKKAARLENMTYLKL